MTSDKAWKFLEGTLALAAVVGIGLWGWSTATRVIYQRWGNWSFQPEDARSQAATQAPPDSPLGRVLIPRLGVSAIVREGTGDATLRVAAGHITGTAMPGQPGNAAVAAHRDSLFRGLRDIRKNDVIVFEASSGRHTYEVESTSIVKPEDVSVLKAGSYPELTLVTCYPFSWVGFAPERFIVKAREVSPGTPVTIPVQTPPRQPSDHRVYFQVAVHHSRVLAPGISIGVTAADADSKAVEAWMWLMPDRRTIWLRGQDSKTPVRFRAHEDGTEREVVITGVSRNAVSGYLITLQGR